MVKAQVNTGKTISILLTMWVISKQNEMHANPIASCRQPVTWVSWCLIETTMWQFLTQLINAYPMVPTWLIWRRYWFTTISPSVLEIFNLASPFCNLDALHLRLSSKCSWNSRLIRTLDFPECSLSHQRRKGKSCTWLALTPWHMVWTINTLAIRLPYCWILLSCHSD